MFPQQIGVILTRLEQAGFAAYAVGGCVRDTLLGRVPEDWDVTTAARPEQVSALFAGHCIPTGLRHGTVTVRQDGLSVEVTTFRADGPYSDHRRPDAVYFSDSLAEDLARRDLTVNAMAMDVRGDITDLYGGRDDLRRGILRCVGDPDKRFDEDALRIMRTLRFASVLGFTVEAYTTAALHRCAPLLRDIAAERLLTEMDRLLCGAYVLPVLLAYPDVLGVFLPELLPCVGLDQRNRHHLYDVWEHTARSVAAIPSEPVLRWAMLLHDVGKPACFTVDGQGVGHFYGHPKVSAALAEEICRRLRMDKRTAHEIVTLVQWHDRDIPRTEKTISRAVHQLGEDTFRRLLAIKRADNLAQHPDYRGRLTEIDKAEAILDGLLAKQACFSLRDLAVNGGDLLALGLRGPAVGHTLNALLEQVLDGTLPNERDAAGRRPAAAVKKEYRANEPRGALFLCLQPEAAAVEFQQALPLHPPQLPGQGAAVDPQHLRHLLPGIGEPEVVAASLLPAVTEEQQDTPPQLRLCQIRQAPPQLPELPGCLRQQISPQRDVTGTAPPAVGQDAVQRQKQHLRPIGGGHQRQRTGLSRRHQQVAEHAALFLPRRQCCCAVLAVLHRVHTAVQHDACHGYGIPGVP